MLCIRGASSAVFRHKVLLTLSACLHQLESLSFPGFQAASVSAPSARFSPLKDIIYFPKIKTLHLPKIFLSARDLKLVFDGCPSLLEARIAPQASSISITHERLEILSAGSMTTPCSSLRLRTPALSVLEVKSFQTVKATVSPHLERLVMKEGASNSNSWKFKDIAPFPSKLKCLHVHCKLTMVSFSLGSLNSSSPIVNRYTRWSSFPP